jgi:RNA recognition motif-containing protein
MINDRETGRFRGFCFVEMADAAADAAIEALNGKDQVVVVVVPAATIEIEIATGNAVGTKVYSRLNTASQGFNQVKPTK